MPVIVVGADTSQGRAVVKRLVEPGREVRAFVSDPDVGAELRELGVKVALGDVSDDSHVQGACMNCFTAVLITEAALDKRERSFATNERQVLEGWALAAAASGVTRVIWVHDGEPPPVRVKEVRTVSPDHPDLVAEVSALDDARFLPQ
ncbi:MAG TPA: NAD(P)H-binding protein [Acidimicrobiia bacterium]|nr:NAD(P)H-binding protein [Acidimicrobiia bacterium]